MKQQRKWPWPARNVHFSMKRFKALCARMKRSLTAALAAGDIDQMPSDKVVEDKAQQLMR